MVIIIAGTMIFQSFDVIDFWFQSQIQSKYTVLARNTAFLIISGVYIGLILNNAPLMLFAWGRLAEIFIFAAGLIIFFFYSGSSVFNFHLNRKLAARLLGDSWPLILSGIMIMIYMRIDQVMLGELIGVDSVGIYSAAIRLTEVWYFIPTAVLISVFPSIVETKRDNEALYYRRLQRLYNGLTWAGIAIAVPVTIIASPAIVYIYGIDYAEAAPVLTITIWAGIFVFQGMARSKWLIAENLQMYSVLFSLVGGIINVMLNFILIPKYATIGAALSTLITYIIIVIFIPLFYKSTRVSSLMLLRSFILRKFIPIK
jgi:polysaccharide transporter, PST family